MLTRDSVKIEWSDDMDDQMHEAMAMSEEEQAAADAEFDRESLTWERRHKARLAAMNSLQRYRYERHHLLVSILRCRARRDNYRREGVFGFLVPGEEAILRKRQMAMMDWRRFLVTGIVPSEEAQ